MTPIISSIETSRAAIFVTGKPSPNLYKLAKQLASKWNMVFIDPQTLVESVVTSPSNLEEYKPIKEALLNGEIVSNASLTLALKLFLQSDNVLFKGAIIYGFFDICREKEDISLFIQSVWNPSVEAWKKENVQFLSIYVHFEDEDVLAARQTKYLFDPETRIYYLTEDVEFSRNYHSKKKVANEDGETSEEESEQQPAEVENPNDLEVDKGEDAAALNDNNENDQGNAAGNEEGENPDTEAPKDSENENTGEQESAEEIARKKKLEEKKRLIPVEVLARLIVRIEDMEGRVQADLDRFAVIEPEIKSFFHNLPELYHYYLEGTQGVEDLEKCVAEIMDRLGLHVDLCRPKPLSISDDPNAPNQFHGMAPDDILARLLTVDEEDEAFSKPRRRLSQFNRLCPVSYHTRKAGLQLSVLVEGLHDYAVLFKHFVYYLADRASMDKFIAYPYKYIRCQPSHSLINIVLTGPPGCGKSLLAKEIAKKRGLILVDPEAMKEDVAFMDKMIAGGGFSHVDQILAWITSFIKEKLVSGYNGWIIDGLLGSKSHFESLAANGLKPDLVVSYRHENADIAKSKLDQGLFYTPQSHELSQILYVNPFTAKPGSTLNPKIPVNGIKVPEEFDISNILEEFERDVVDLGVYLQAEKIPLLNYNSRTSAQKIYYDVICKLDPFYPRAVNTILPDENTFDNPNLCFGETKHFCPVTFKNHGVLRQADPIFAALYQAKCYIFPSKENMDAFMESPDYYTNYGSQRVTIPPPRIFAVGPSQCGKTTLLSELAKDYKNSEIKLLTFNETARKWAKEQGMANGHATAMLSYLKDSDANPLPDETFQLFLNYIFYSFDQGVMLEGFPKSRKEAELMEQFGFYPDAVVHYVMDGGLYAAKNLKKALHDVKTRMIKNEETGKMVPANYENPEEVAKNELAETFEKESERNEEIVEFFKTSMKVTTVPLNGAKCLRFNLCQSRKGLYPFLNGRSSLFLHTVPISRKKAKELISTGFAKQSQFGNYCPVEIKRHQAYFESFRAEKPVISGDKIYYLLTGKNVKEFLRNPNLYISEGESKGFRSKGTPAIIMSGSPKSGKTSLARRLSTCLGVQYLNVSEILRLILERKEDSSLKKEIINGLIDGQVIDAKLCIKAMKAVLGSYLVLSKGWVLDDFPISASEIELLEEASIVPHLVLNLQTTGETQSARLKTDQNDYRSLLVQNVTASAIVKKQSAPAATTAAYQMATFEVADDLESRKHNWDTRLKSNLTKSYGEKRGNIVDVDSESSKWFVATLASSICDNIFSTRQEFVAVTAKGLPFPIEKCGIHRDYVESHWGKFNTYCPVSFVDQQELVNINLTYTPSLIVYYGGLFYKVENQSCLKKFLANPSKYTENSPNLPDLLPEPLSFKSFDEIKFPLALSLKGYCPVAFRLGKGKYESIIMGLPSFCAKYDGQLYSFCCESHHDHFMRQPWKYTGQNLPKKLPPPAVFIDIKNLPIMGYLEQNVSLSVQKALVAVGNSRPKLSNLSIADSATRYLALYFKANNSKLTSHVRKGYQKRLEALIQSSDHLRLISSSFSLGSYVPFKVLNDPLKNALGQVYDITSDLPGSRKSSGIEQKFQI